ncbi:MAG TPA: AraC family transcriptional regulator ligand-binding domain-containing protein [Mycobacterium sp.]
MTAGVYEKEPATDDWLPRSSASAVLLTALGQEFGVARDVLLAGTGLDLAGLHAPTTEILAGQELQLIRNFINAVPAPGLGFAVGRRYHLGMCPEWVYAILTSRTLREAFEVGVRYADLTYMFSKFVLVDQGRCMKIVIDDSNVPGDLRRFLLERDIAATFANAAAALVFLPTIRSATLALPAPDRIEHRLKYAATLGVQPVWNADETAITFDSETLSRPLPGGLNPRAAHAARRACAEHLARLRRHSGFTSAVRKAIAAASPGASQTEIAAALHVSLRTLRRRLADEGTTFRHLARETWGEVAEELLTRGLTVEQVADRVGYAGPSSFTRAFKSWRGTSPGTLGRRGRAQTAVGSTG